MNAKQRKAITDFFKTSKVLKELGVIRSTSYTGNIAEFICASEFNIRLSDSQREIGLDGTDSDNRNIEIKYHNGEKGTNIIMGKYKDHQNFQDLIVILGPDSCLRAHYVDEELFEIYRINDYKFEEGKNIGKGVLEGKLKFLLDSNLEKRS
ncbi:hypothetical protein QH639_15875 [Lysinibacillus sp. 1 U-2021]|uniref:hypothetical protein n=1 Tax=Lysinibacillus sp. 1 U-2021 TaxID=3039426 RepID=UPI00248112D7|nr:hypothetical protein [Lysinibacillus sp. 1 U-2021]WGT37317.1 hypothetical protein QH639_15875 [Lysinibacillus sp. 1 U-2021]